MLGIYSSKCFSIVHGEKVDFIVANKDNYDKVSKIAGDSIPVHLVLSCELDKLSGELEKLPESFSGKTIYFFDAFTDRGAKKEAKLIDVEFDVLATCKKMNITLVLVLFGWQHTNDRYVKLAKSLDRCYSLISSDTAYQGIKNHEWVLEHPGHGWAVNGNKESSDAIRSAIDVSPDNVIYWSGDLYSSTDQTLMQDEQPVKKLKFVAPGRVRLKSFLTMRQTPSLLGRAFMRKGNTGIDGELDFVKVEEVGDGLVFLQCKLNDELFWIAAVVGGKENVEIL